MFNTTDFLNFSKNLLRRGGIRQNEALFRSVISRAYYSAFLSAREKIDTLNAFLLIHIQGSTMHQQVVDTLNDVDFRFYHRDPHLGQDLYELHSYRIDADYKFPSAIDTHEHCRHINPDTKAWALTCIQLSEDIINRVNNLI